MKMHPIAMGVGAGVLAALVLAPATGDALGKLAAVRADKARLTTVMATPDSRPPLLAQGLAVGARDAVGSRAAIMQRVQQLAKAGGVLVEETSAARAPEGIGALRIRVSGAEKAVISLADALERGRPFMRLRSWRIEPVPGGVRLTGEVVAAWQ